MRLFGSFQKVEERADGTLFVAGIASSESVDSSNEVVQADAMKAAMPDFLKFGSGNLREMHQLMAAGTVDKCEVQDDGSTYIETIVVDPIAVKKVQTGVYKGFSIGGKVTARDKLNKSQITGIRLNEISLVDRPCNPDAVITLYKIDTIEDEPVQKTETAPTAVEQAAIDAIADLLNKGTIKASDLLKAAQNVITPPVIEPAVVVAAAEPLVAKVDKLAGEALQKGMFGLNQFAELLQSAAWLVQDAEWEAQVEGDKSKIPAKLREWLSAGGAIFAAMTKEELAELIASASPPAAAVIVAADAGGDLGKVEEPAPAVIEPAAVVAVVEPAAAVAAVVDPLAKLEAAEATFTEELKKRDDQLSKAMGAIDALTKRLEAIEAQPMPGKALLKAIGKGDDLGSTTPAKEVDPVLKADGSVDEAATLLKTVHAQGGIPLSFR